MFQPQSRIWNTEIPMDDKAKSHLQTTVRTYKLTGYESRILHILKQNHSGPNSCMLKKRLLDISKFWIDKSSDVTKHDAYLDWTLSVGDFFTLFKVAKSLLADSAPSRLGRIIVPPSILESLILGVEAISRRLGLINVADSYLISLDWGLPDISWRSRRDLTVPDS